LLLWIISGAAIMIVAVGLDVSSSHRELKVKKAALTSPPSFDEPARRCPRTRHVRGQGKAVSRRSSALAALLLDRLPRIRTSICDADYRAQGG
jgi:hypothetical protein